MDYSTNHNFIVYNGSAGLFSADLEAQNFQISRNLIRSIMNNNNENSALNKPAVISWVAVSEKLPTVEDNGGEGFNLQNNE